MSGGSLDYVCYKLDDAIEVIERRATTVLQIAFAAHLKDVSKALHDLELVFSGDYGDGDDVEALRKVVNKEMELEAVAASESNTGLHAGVKSLREKLKQEANYLQLKDWHKLSFFERQTVKKLENLGFLEKKVADGFVGRSI